MIGIATLAVVSVAAIKLYQEWCRPEITPAVLRGGSACSLFDVNDLTRREGKAVMFLEEGWVYAADQEGIAVLELKADFDVSALKAIDPWEPNYFRIDFNALRKIERLSERPDHLTPIDISRIAQPFVAARGLNQLTRFETGNRLAWLFPAYRWGGFYAEGAFGYSAAGGEPVSAYHSPGGAFLVLTSESVTNRHNSATYIEIFRRRDNESLALLRTSCCGTEPTYADHEHGWINDRDFLYVTGSRFSQVIACRFDP
jgi:hypothetical protein